MKVERTTTIGEIVKEHPDAAGIVMSYGLHCIGCHVASWETLEQGCRGHGMPEEIIDELVEELNLFIEEEAAAAQKELSKTVKK